MFNRVKLWWLARQVMRAHRECGEWCFCPGREPYLCAYCEDQAQLTARYTALYRETHPESVRLAEQLQGLYSSAHAKSE